MPPIPGRRRHDLGAGGIWGGTESLDDADDGIGRFTAPFVDELRMSADREDVRPQAEFSESTKGFTYKCAIPIDQKAEIPETE